MSCTFLNSCDLFNRPETLYEDGWRELNQGNLDIALQKADQGLQLYRSSESDWFWRFRALKAEILVWQHRNEESLQVNQADIPARLATSDSAAWRRLSQSVASAYTHQLSDAHRYLDEAEAIAKAHHPELLGQVELRRGTILFRDGAIIDAQTAYRRALQLAREENNRYLEAAALGSLGMVAAKQEHYDESLDWNRTALQLSRVIGASSSIARILGNLAWSYQELGDYENALANYREAEETSARNGQIGDQLYWRTGVATMYYALGDSASAKAVLQDALDQARHQDDKSITAEYLNDLATFAIEKGDVSSASTLIAEATASQQKGGDPSALLDTRLLDGRIAEMNGMFDDAENCFRALSSDPHSSTAQRWEAEARLGQLHDRKGEPLKAEFHYLRSIQTIQNARQSVAQDELRLSFLSSAVEFYDDYISFLIQHKRIADALRVADVTRAQTLAEGLGYAVTKPAYISDPRNLAEKLHAVLLLYWVGHTHSSLWVITPSKLGYFSLPGRADINLALAAYRKDILQGRDPLAGSANGTHLYDMLVAPAHRFIPRNSRVIVLPAESLYSLNFETLIVPEPHVHFWIEDVTLSTASSLAALSAPQQRTVTRANNLLLIGDPVPPNTDFPRLTQASAEVARIKTHFVEPQRNILTGQQATVSAYLDSDPEKYSYVHFATHGTSSYLRPLESAVILSKQGDVFKLYARDIVAHHLNARLVTISACDAAGTRAFAGEGLVGLCWAFLRAGARNVVATLWEVSDASSTTQLMDSLYDGLEHGEDPAIALRNAKLLLLHSNSDTVFRKPFYWGPFQLYGGS